MSKDTAIQWTDHTFNPWWGCVRVSPGCEHCYAEADAKRYGHNVWGVQAPRRFFGENHWREPLKWNAAAVELGERRRVFCASMCDWAEIGDQQLELQRLKLFELIRMTPGLDWQLLTKRPENVAQVVPAEWMANGFPRNVWLGTTVEDNRRAERIRILRELPAELLFLSMEPLLELVPLELSTFEWVAEGPDADGVSTMLRPIKWVIVGGESGAKARACEIRWIREVVSDVEAGGAAVFVKQLGAEPMREGHIIDGLVPIKLKHRKGGDWGEWPLDLRVRDFPVVGP